MNVENIRKLADIIEQPKSDGLNLGFNMRWWNEETKLLTRNARAQYSDGCGTVACIGGTINVLAGHASSRDSFAAAQWLGVDGDDAIALFYPVDARVWRATRSQAAKVLRHLADTGKVDWSVAFQAEPVQP